MGPKGETDTKTNWSTDRRPYYKINSTQLSMEPNFTENDRIAYRFVSRSLISFVYNNTLFYYLFVNFCSCSIYILLTLLSNFMQVCDRQYNFCVC
jgi:hypothetical protein